MNELTKWLLNHKLIKIRPKHIAYWVNIEDMPELRQAYRDGDYKIRLQIAGALGTIISPAAKLFLKDIVHDKVLIVAEAAADSLRKVGVSKSEDEAIEAILEALRTKERSFRQNLKASVISFQGQYIDRSKMTRMAQLKNATKQDRGGFY